ncbi:hypothetical protein E2K93_10315 [Thalassotalea sp. HSM 43]|uniref:cytochrome c n=1 Tax=Thalassotalea sp. HSM 43 TaxID=2552945 RepID=UPI0010814B5B|nr:cytochrome c [Thalassotalea sp. HSM 43]QBY04754.1 hypothetical protein E2K93_10315 [Thalassotalea sp. HSM 43]
MIKKVLLGALISLSTMSTAFAAHPMCGETELARIMSDMKNNMKAIKNSFKRGEQELLDDAAKALLSNIRESDTLVPLSISDKKELSEEQKKQFNDYQKGMAALEEATMELIAAKDDAERKAAIGKIGKTAKKGHKAFKMDCDE